MYTYNGADLIRWIHPSYAAVCIVRTWWIYPSYLIPTSDKKKRRPHKLLSGSEISLLRLCNQCKGTLRKYVRVHYICMFQFIVTEPQIVRKDLTHWLETNMNFYYQWIEEKWKKRCHEHGHLIRVNSKIVLTIFHACTNAVGILLPWMATYVLSGDRRTNVKNCSRTKKKYNIWARCGIV